MHLIGVDIGTQGTKASLFTASGELVSEAFEASNLISRVPGEVEQDPGEIYGSVLRTIREVAAKAGVRTVDAIAIDGQMSGIMGIDEDWNAVTPYDSWLDTRCERYIELMKSSSQEDIIRICGGPPTYDHGPKMLWWMHERPEVFGRIHKFVLPSAYAAGRLAGLRGSDAFMDYTFLHFTCFADVEKKCWSERTAHAFGFDTAKLPRIVNPWDIIGHLAPEAAQQCGLISGIPIAAGCGDQPATSLGAGITRVGQAFDGAGTASVFSCALAEYKPDAENKTVFYARSVIDNLWIPLAYTNGSGLCLKWFAEGFTSLSLSELDEESSRAEAGSGGLIFIPHFAGRVCPNNPKVKGSWIGLTFSHSREHLYRSIMEAIAYECAIYKRILNTSIDEVRVIGGGAKSSVFNQIKADVLGVRHSTLAKSGGTTYGSAVIAGYSVGMYNSIAEEIDRNVAVKDSFEPDASNAAVYERCKELYEKYLGFFDLFS